jgi:hypothetical protein
MRHVVVDEVCGTDMRHAYLKVRDHCGHLGVDRMMLQKMDDSIN